MLIVCKLVHGQYQQLLITYELVLISIWKKDTRSFNWLQVLARLMNGGPLVKVGVDCLRCPEHPDRVAPRASATPLRRRDSWRSMASHRPSCSRGNLVPDATSLHSCVSQTFDACTPQMLISRGSPPSRSRSQWKFKKHPG